MFAWRTGSVTASAGCVRLVRAAGASLRTDPRASCGLVAANYTCGCDPDDENGVKMASDGKTEELTGGHKTADDGAKKPRFRALPSPKRLIVVVLLTYLAVCLFVVMFQSSLIYFPTPDYPVTPKAVGLEYEDLTLTTGDGLSIAAWYLPHDQARGTFIYCHGNAGNISNRLHSLKLLHQMGVNVLIFDYRGYGRSEGKPSEKGTYEDAETAWRYLTETRGESPDRIVIFGRSLGGAVAIELAKRQSTGKERAAGESQAAGVPASTIGNASTAGVPAGSGPAALVVESTFTDLLDIGRLHYRFLPVRFLLTYRYASIEKVADITCPKLFFHGEADTLIPFANGRKLFAAAAEPKRFVATPGDHNDGGFAYSPEYTDQLAKFVAEVLSIQ